MAKAVAAELTAMKLSQRLDDVKRQAEKHGPTMVPDWKPSANKEEEKAPDIKTLEVPLAERVQISTLVKEHYALGRQISEFKKQQKTITNRAKKLIHKNKLEKFLVGDIPVDYYNAPRSSIKAALMLANGFSVEDIKACTETKDCFTLRIGGGGKKEEEDE